MALRLPKRFAALYVIFPVVLASALALGRYSYRWVEQLAGSEALIESNRVLGERTLDRIDSYIFDSDRQYFDLIDLERLNDIKRTWTNLVRVSPAIDAMVGKLPPGTMNASISGRSMRAKASRAFSGPSWPIA